MDSKMRSLDLVEQGTGGEWDKTESLTEILRTLPGQLSEPRPGNTDEEDS